jgi:hypothetical protein
MANPPVPPASEPRPRGWETVRVIVVAGIPFGVIVAGLGSRLAMLLLRLTSPDRVIGVRSDDDFVIGRFTLAGTYNLCVLGAAFGVIGAAAYLLVAPRLIGPRWFRRVTVGLAAGAVVGSMLVHSEGIDFTQLKPKWFAIALFVALPTLFGTFIGSAVDAVKKPGSWTNIGRRRWLLPFIAIACFPPTILVVIVIATGTAIATAIAEIAQVRVLRATAGFTFVVRFAWLLIALAGLNALLNDIAELT